jgi:hypothetical protein
VEFVFAPGERDVYSHWRQRKDLAPLGAKYGNYTFAEVERGIALLRSAEVKKVWAGYKHLAPWGEATNVDPLHFEVELASEK